LPVLPSFPLQPSGTPEYKPAKPFTIDVTRAMKAIAAREQTFHGIALRIVPIAAWMTDTLFAAGYRRREGLS